jgi:hypothetical protein
MANALHPSRHGKRGDTSADFERSAKESAKAWEAFVVYRDLPISERSLTTVSQRLGKSRSLCARWSSSFRWVERAEAWDNHQDQMRRNRLAAERDKICERQMQHNRIASQALIAPLVALAKRAQTKADAFAGVSAAELTKLAAFAARALPGIHEDERKVAGRTDEARNKQAPVRIASAEFTWVQGRCTCGHTWDQHHRSASAEHAPVAGTRCTGPACPCEEFVDDDSDL